MSSIFALNEDATYASSFNFLAEARRGPITGRDGTGRIPGAPTSNEVQMKEPLILSFVA